MKIDEMLHDIFQYEIDNQNFREPNPEEIMRAVDSQKTIPEKKPRFFFALAAAVLGGFIFVLSFSLSFNNIPMMPLAKIITMNLPENPADSVFAFWASVQSGMYSEK